MKSPRPENQVAAFLRGKASTDEWFTPLNFIRALGEFDLDPACGALCRNRTARRRYQEHGLEQAWAGRVWLNPPFSDARPWVEKLAAHGNGILLVFARTDAVWFQRAVAAAGAVFAIKGRIQFTRPGGGPSRCPLGCVLIPFGGANIRAIRRSGIPGLFLSVPAAPTRPADGGTVSTPHPARLASPAPNARVLTLSQKASPARKVRSNHD